jgi:hypothetical protein
MGLLRKITAVSTLGASELARPTNIRKMTGTYTAPPVVVKTYKNAKEYEHDVKSMTGQGYMPQGQSADGGRVTMTRIVAIGLFSLAAKKGKGLTVTWVHSGATG